MTDEVTAVLKAARAKIANPDAWTRGGFARDRYGSQANPCESRAVCWCALGVIEAVSPLMGRNYHAALGRLVHALPKGRKSVPHFNDADTTTHADILALFDRAIAAEDTAP